MQSLENKIAIVTGGGQGLGASICEVLAEAGCTIIAADIRPEILDDVKNRIEKKNGKAVAKKLDVSNPDDVQKILNEVQSEFGRIDFVINNAGVDVTKPILEMEVNEWQRVINVNLTGPFLMTKFALPYMKEQKYGHIVNIGSTAAKRSWPNASAYHASKWGLIGFSHAAFTEARDFGIKVTAVIAGGMRTPFILDRFPDTDINKLQEPKNVAETVRFILQQPQNTIIPEVLVLPLMETSWP